MVTPTRLAGVLLPSLLSIALAQTPPQSAAPNSKPLRIPIKQEHLCCYEMKFVTPVYPREARLEHIEGVVKLALVIAEKGPVVDLQPVSGDPLPVDDAMKAVRQWRIYDGMAVVGGRPVEYEIALTFTFRIQHPPRPAYLHLTNGDVVRADEVHEFTDGFEYTVGHNVHRTPADLVTNVDACARVTVAPRKEGDCIPAGRPSFDIRAIPSLPVTKPSPFDTPLHSIATESKSERIHEWQNRRPPMVFTTIPNERQPRGGGGSSLFHFQHSRPT